MTSFLSSQSRLRRGKWTNEEEIYASCIIEAFTEGSLNDVDEGMSLRGYLAEKLRTNVKRISKKYEGTNYNGKRMYLKKTNLPVEVVAARHAKLKELELKFEKSVKLMEDAESAKSDMARLNASPSLMSSSHPSLAALTNSLQAPPAVIPPNSLAGQAAFVSRDALDENIRILAHQSALNSLESTRSLTGAAGLGSALHMSAFGGGPLSNPDIQHALMGNIAAAPPSPAAAAAAAAFPPMFMPSSPVSGTVLNQMILRQQHQEALNRTAAELLALENQASQARLLLGIGGGAGASAAAAATTGALMDLPAGVQLAMKRSQQAQSILDPPAATGSRKRAKLY